MLESLSLEGKSVVITGGGTGLGRAMVRDMARAGANLMIAGRRSGPIEEAAAEAESLGVKAFSEATDVTDSAQVAALMKACMDRFGKIDVLLNNAGAVSDNVRKPIWELTDEEWDRVMRVNLTGAFYCAREVSQPMVAQGHGKIINTASGFGLRGGREIYMYCCSKGGMIQLSRVLFSIWLVTASPPTLSCLVLYPLAPLTPWQPACPGAASSCQPASWANPKTSAPWPFFLLRQLQTT